MVIKLFYLFVVLIIFYCVLEFIIKYSFYAQVKTLFANSIFITKQTYRISQIETLPKPVQKYFQLVLQDGQPYISYVRMKHSGQFKTGLDKEWINIEGEQYATTATPGFIWKGTTRYFIAKDIYIKDKGQLTVSLLSLIKVVDGKGTTYDQGELLRRLAESVLYPTNLLPSNRLSWFPKDEKSALITFNYKGLSLFFTVIFNEVGEIIEMETNRYMDAKSLEKWVIKLSVYKEFNKVKVPTLFEVIWRLERGDFSYAKFTLDTIEYDIPRKF